MGLVLGIYIAILFIIVSTVIVFVKGIKEDIRNGNFATLAFTSFLMLVFLGGTIFVIVYYINY